MKILLGSSRVAMKLLLKILLQCRLPVDGSSAGRGGSAQAARAHGVGRAGAQRRAPTRVTAPTAGGQAGCAAAPGKNPPTHTPGQRGIRVGWGYGGGNKASLGLVGEEGEISAWGTPRTAEEPSVGMRAPRRRGSPARAPAQIPSPPVPLFGFIWTILCFLKKKKKGKISNYQPRAPFTRNAAWAGTVGPLRCGFKQLAGKKGVQSGSGEGGGRASLRLPRSEGERAQLSPPLHLHNDVLISHAARGELAGGRNHPERGRERGGCRGTAPLGGWLWDWGLFCFFFFFLVPLEVECGRERETPAALGNLPRENRPPNIHTPPTPLQG